MLSPPHSFLAAKSLCPVESDPARFLPARAALPLRNSPWHFPAATNSALPRLLRQSNPRARKKSCRRCPLLLRPSAPASSHEAASLGNLREPKHPVAARSPLVPGPAALFVPLPPVCASPHRPQARA